MLTLVTGVLRTSDEFISAPTDLLTTVSFNFSGTDVGELEHKEATDIEAARVYDASGNLATGKPFIYNLAGGTLYFPVVPDTAYAYRLWYYAQPEALSSSNLTNFITTRHPRLLRCTCLAFANEFMKQEQDKVYWLRLAQNEIDVIQGEDSEIAQDLNIRVVIT